jgi:anti-sigma B factor antagonist
MDVDSPLVAEEGIFEVVVESVSEEARLVRVSGELDLATAPALEAALVASDADAGLVVDLSGCTFVDSTSVRVLLELARERESNGGRTAVVASDPGVLRVLEITALDTLLPIYRTADDAVAYVS